MAGRLTAISAVDRPGGAETCLLRFLTGLAARGWDVALATPTRGALAESALAAGHRWLALPVGGLARGAGVRAVLSWPRARRLSGSEDVVYLNGGVPGRLLPALPARAALRVLHIHDMVRRAPRFWGRADLLLTASRAVSERISALGGPRSEVVYGPVDADPPPAEAPWAPRPDGGPVVGFIGRIEPRKGPLDLVEAAPAIRAAIPGARIVLVGDDPYGTDSDYLARVRASDAVEHIGWVANAPGVMRHLDVLVLPSYEEPFGTVLSEAMAVGTPVVASAVDGLGEVVLDGVTGRLVPPGEPDRIAEAVLEVLRERPRMAAAARQHAARFHAERYVEHVERLICERRPGGLT